MEIFGPLYLGDGKAEFKIWSPLLQSLSVKLSDERVVPLRKNKNGYFEIKVDRVKPDEKYYYILNNNLQRPDPSSHYQPNDVLSASCLVDHESFPWQDSGWQPESPEKMIMYELHVGTFSHEGNFDGVIKKLSYFQDLGINAIEIMPVAQFSGHHNWGYDGVYPFSVQNSYGGPFGFKRLVNECHLKKINVILDVVYNHLGPEGNFLPEFMPCFTEKYKTPWGSAMNYDDEYSNGIRNFFIQNAIHWFKNYHIDALRLDAIHSIYDMSAKHFLKELAEEVQIYSNSRGKKCFLFAESDLNDIRVIMPHSKGGYGIDAQWSDDFHHSIHTLLTKETTGYYQDYGSIEHLAKAIKDGFVYSWDYSSYRKKNYGSCSKDISPSKFIVCSQNHDQIGNRMKGERLSSLVSFEGLKTAAGLVILSNKIPLLFMGEEYCEDSPFLYFVDFHDHDLLKAVNEGRKNEFESFHWSDEEIDNPSDERTFLKSTLKSEKLNLRSGERKIMIDFYKELINLRKNNSQINDPETKLKITSKEKDKILFIKRENKEGAIFIIVNFNDKQISYITDVLNDSWVKIIYSAEPKWLGNGSLLPQIINQTSELLMEPLSFALYAKK